MGAASVKTLAALVIVLLVGCTGESTTEEEPRDYGYMESVLFGLSARYPEVTDTAVRDSVLRAVYCSVVHEEPVPSDFGMFSPAGDRAVWSRVLAFVGSNREATDGLTEEERIEVLWGDDWGENVYLEPSDCSGL